MTATPSPREPDTEKTEHENGPDLDRIRAQIPDTRDTALRHLPMDDEGNTILSPREPMISRAAAYFALRNEVAKIERELDIRRDHAAKGQPLDRIVSNDDLQGLILGLTEATRILANLPAFDAQPDITKDWLDGLIEPIVPKVNHDPDYERCGHCTFTYGANALRDAILLSLKGG